MHSLSSPHSSRVRAACIPASWQWAIWCGDGSYGIFEVVLIIDEPQVMDNLSESHVATYLVGEGRWVVHNEDFTILDMPIGISDISHFDRMVVELMVFNRSQQGLAAPWERGFFLDTTGQVLGYIQGIKPGEVPLPEIWLPQIQNGGFSLHSHPNGWPLSDKDLSVALTNALNMIAVGHDEVFAFTLQPGSRHYKDPKPTLIGKAWQSGMAAYEADIVRGRKEGAKRVAKLTDARSIVCKWR